MKKIKKIFGRLFYLIMALLSIVFLTLKKK